MKTLFSAMVLAGFVLCVAPAIAVGQYTFDILNTDSGLPQNSVNAIIQTRDGYLWCATFDGLVRYNGSRFEVFNKSNSKGLNSNRFLSLSEDPDGTLWAGTEDGGLTRYAGGRFKTYDMRDGLPATFVMKMRRTEEGDLLVVTAAGLARMRGEKFEVVSTDINSFDSDLGTPRAPGEVWSRVGRRLRRLKDGKATLYDVPDGGRGWLLSNQLYVDRQKRVWIASVQSPTRELWMLKDDAFIRYSVADGLPLSDIDSFCEDHEGTMWFGTGRGLVRFKDGRFTTYTTADGLSSNVVLPIVEDREGTLWIGTRDNGITRITRRIITTISEKDGLKGRIFYPILEDRSGSIWVAFDGINRIKDGKSTYFSLQGINPRLVGDKTSPVLVEALHQDREGRLWIGNTHGLFRFENDKFTYDSSMTTRGGPYCIFQDSRGAFWFGYNELLTRYYNGQVRNFTSEDGLHGFVQPVYEDRQGRIWIGSYGGLAQYVDDRLVFLTEKDGLSSDRVRAIYEDDDGVVWIGTYDGGLNRFKDGRFTSFTTKEGMYSNGVFSILEDRRGNFWIGSNTGIHRVRKQQLNDFAEGRTSKLDAISYGKADGMLNAECNGARHPAAIKTRDGRMWFPTFDGVAVVDPEAVTFNNVPPPVVIEQVVLERQNMDLNQAIEIHPGQDNLEVHYAGLSFIKPENVEFRYRLEGLDEKWVEAGNRRVAYYTHLPGGSYTFRVIAANSDGVWNEAGAQIGIVVIPAFYRTWWFTLLIGLSVAGLAIVFYRVRVNRLRIAHAVQEAFSRRLLESQELERKRIAAELHDSLGQNLLIIKNRALLGLRPHDLPPATSEQLDEISSLSSQALEECREIAYNLRPYQIDRLGLSRAIEAMIKKVAVSSGIRFLVEVAELKGALSKDAEINLYRVVQECVNNIVKHSGASEGKVIITRGNQGVQLLIEDNGKGFSTEQPLPAESRASGFGLFGISERVRLLGGTSSIESTPGRGTAISISISEHGDQNGQ